MREGGVRQLIVPAETSVEAASRGPSVFLNGGSVGREEPLSLTPIELVVGSGLDGGGTFLIWLQRSLGSIPKPPIQTTK